MLADNVLEYCVIGLISILFYYFIVYYFYVGLKNEWDVFLTFNDLYNYMLGGGRNCFITSSTNVYFYITSFIFGLGAFISATVLGNWFLVDLLDIIDSLIIFSALFCPF